METTENNKLIAQFMGLEQWNESYYKHPNIFYSHYKESPTQVHFENLQYHKSWDWLMPVVREVVTLIDINKLDFDNSGLKYDVLDNDIKQVYFEVIEFINWFNKQN